jgi:hypothetical protein
MEECCYHSLEWSRDKVLRDISNTLFSVYSITMMALMHRQFLTGRSAYPGVRRISSAPLMGWLPSVRNGEVLLLSVSGTDIKPFPADLYVSHSRATSPNWM